MTFHSWQDSILLIRLHAYLGIPVVAALWPDGNQWGGLVAIHWGLMALIHSSKGL
jgi:hypothetical protein